MSELKLFNSLTRELATFKPIHPGTEGDSNDPPEARVYTCGPTVYNYQHIGNMRAYIFADTLGRVLTYKGYKLTHVVNITDVGHLTSDADAGEDKMEKMAANLGKSAWDIAAYYQADFERDLDRLNVRKPAHPKATEYVEQMILWGQAIANEHCYELDSGLYFDTSTVADYGRLARHSSGANDPGAESRIDPVDGKRHAADFAIWRKTPAGETRQMEWDSPWGKGAPGWHLECSVMSEALLGLPFDIHTGGIDHREIHHPNEIAQNQARCHSDASGANIWMHNNFLIERSGKMSKSSGEFLRLQLLIDKGFHPLAYRLMCLQAHYRSELEFSWEGLQAAFVRLKRMVGSILKLKETQQLVDALREHSTDQSADNEPWWRAIANEKMSFDEIAWEKAVADRFDQAIFADLNTPEAIPQLDAAINYGVMELVDRFDQVLGFNLLSLTRTDLRIRPKTAVITEAEIETALAARKEARAAKDFAKSDAIRDDLIAKGVEVMDGDPLGWDWKLDV